VPDDVVELRYKNGMELLPSHIKYFDRVALIDSTQTISEIEYIIGKNSIRQVTGNPSIWSQNIVKKYKKE